jgi:biopolymer transport protein ExbD
MSVGGGKSSVKAEPNVTPMIDVMLVLLIIFMLIVPNITAGFQAVPPAGQNLKPHPEDEKDQILGIDVNGQYYLNRDPIPNSDLEARLTAIYNAREEDKIMYLKADKGLDYGKVLDVLDVAAKAGVRKTAMITEQAPGTVSKIETDRVIGGGMITDDGGM